MPIKQKFAWMVLTSVGLILLTLAMILQATPASEKAASLMKSCVSEREKRNFDAALGFCNDALRYDPGAAPSYFERGIVYLNKGDEDRAVADLAEAARRDPVYLRRYLDSARQVEGTIAALFWLRAARQANPDNPETYYLLGRTDEGLLIPKGAMDQYTEAIRLNPKYVDAYNSRASLYLKQGEPDKALADWAESIKINPQHPDAYLLRGQLYLANAKYEAAIADFSEVIRIKPTDTAKLIKAYEGRAKAYYETGQHDAGNADYEEAARLG